MLISSFWRKIILSGYSVGTNTPKLIGFGQEILKWAFELLFCLQATQQSLISNGAYWASCWVQLQSGQISDESWWAFKSNALMMFLSLCKHQQCDFLYFSFLESWIERCLNESENKRYSSHTSLGNVSNDESKCLKLSLPWCPGYGLCSDEELCFWNARLRHVTRNKRLSSHLWNTQAFLIISSWREFNAFRWMWKLRPQQKLAVYTFSLSESLKTPSQWCSSGKMWTLSGKGLSL